MKDTLDLLTPVIELLFIGLAACGLIALMMAVI